MKITWKKALYIVLATSICAFTGCSSLGETGGGTGEPILPVLPIPDTSEEIVFPETLDFTPKGIDAQYGYANFYHMQEGEKTYCYFYQDVFKACLSLTDDKTITPVKRMEQDETGEIKESEFYIVKTLDYAKYGLTADEALAVWKTLRMDYPEFYWLDNQVSYSSKTLNLQIIPEYASGNVRAQLQEKIQAKANKCFSYLSADMTTTEMALTIYDYVITSLQYAYKQTPSGEIPEDAVWAHNIVGLADKGKGVCETYAKSFEYLCSLIDIEAITIGGIAGQTKEEESGHAWNAVKLDGEWYCVDLTWGDQTTPYREWFGKGAEEFNATHTPDKETIVFGREWQYKVPTFSKKALSPVRMQTEDGINKMYGCIDYALADITDISKEYTITLLPDTAVTTEKNTKIHHYEISFSTSVLPTAKEIKFIGDRNGIVPLPMRAENAVTLASDIYLQDIAWTYPLLEKNGYEVGKSTFSSYGEEK